MALTITLPEELAYQLDQKVNAGEFSSRDEAAAHFIRKGMGGGGGHRPSRPQPPGTPPGQERPPGSPIQVDPTDVNWAE